MKKILTLVIALASTCMTFGQMMKDIPVERRFHAMSENGKYLASVDQGYIGIYNSETDEYKAFENPNEGGYDLGLGNSLTNDGFLCGAMYGAPAILNIVAFVVILVVVIFALFALGKIIEASIKIIMLGWLNRLLGLLFALLKCTLIIGLVIIMFNSINSSLNLVSEDTLSGSVLYPPFKEMAYSIFPYLKELLFK